jgi:trehalose 2-sulfotransferase
MNAIQPQTSYTIWFTQRTGSTLLCKALEATGIAGKPGEWLNIPNAADLTAHYGVQNPAELQKRLWQLGSTPNRVFGLKFGCYQPHFDNLLAVLRNFPANRQTEPSPGAIWAGAFPHCRHIFMTRRNKVRLAVSWWKAIQSQEWHRVNGQPPQPADLEKAYSFEAIHHLFCESSMREAGIQEFFTGANIRPLTIVYEDFIQDYENSIRNILDFIGLDSSSVKIPAPYYARLADDVSEQWAQRFRAELQKNWQNKGW